MESRAACLLIGVDGGAREAVAPLAAYPAFTPFDGEGSRAGDTEYWDEVYESGRIVGIVTGTSDSPPARKIESAARIAASRRGMKIAAIEDYPGNFFDVPGAHTDLLVAESRFSEQLYRTRLGDRCPPIRIFCSARYDRYRVRADELRASTRTHWEKSRSKPPQILWAGQPETEDCVLTLRRIAPAVAAQEATLLLKAHPRDRGHRQGVYAALLDGLGVKHVDVTHLGVAESLALAPRLVITQFSSVAIEAGFYGIPALHLLYRDAGGARLREKKGFDVPPYCLAGAGRYLQDGGHERDTLREVLHEEAARGAIIGCFDDFFATRAQVTPALADHLAFVMGLP